MMGIRTIVPLVTSTSWQQFREAWMIQRSTMHSFSQTAQLMPSGSGCTISQGNIIQLQLSSNIKHCFFLINVSFILCSITPPVRFSSGIQIDHEALALQICMHALCIP